MPPRKGPEPLVAQLTLLRRLMRRRDPTTLKELLEDGDPDEETVRRHLIRMEKHLEEIEGDGDYNRRWRFVWPQLATVPPTALLALRIAHTLLGSLRGSSLGRAFQAVVEDHDRRTPPSEFKAPDVSRMFYAKSRMLNPLGVLPERLDTLAEAIFNRRKLRIRYTPFDGEPIDRVVEPFTLVFADEGIYLYCRKLDRPDEPFRRGLRLYNVIRIQSLEATGETFTYPPIDLYDPDKEFGDCFGVFVRPDANVEPVRVVVEFSPRWWAYLSAQKWHKSQTSPVRTDDGWCRVEFELHRTHDLTTWLRGHGKEVRVVEPAALAEDVRAGGNPT